MPFVTSRGARAKEVKDELCGFQGSLDTLLLANTDTLEDP